MSTFHPTDRRTAPYNTAYLQDSRQYLYDTFGIDPEHDHGDRCPETGAMTTPPDRRERRAAICSFYGGRCGRCLAPIVSARGEKGDGGATLAYCHSLATKAENRWALAELVPLCHGCYEVVSMTDWTAVDRLGSAYRDAPLFPQWLGDPRVAAERIPLTGREAWIREKLVDRLEATLSASHTDPVAEEAVLTRETAPAVGVALGEALAADAWQPLPAEQRLTDQWDALEPAIRERYEQAVADRLGQRGKPPSVRL